METSLHIAERLYGVLLGLYPARFRDAFAQQMRLSFRDACRDAVRRRGTEGVLTLWLTTLLDLLKSALEERARQGEYRMSNERRIAWSAPLTLTIGLLWIVASIGELVLLTNFRLLSTPWTMFWFLPITLSYLLMIPAFIGTRLRYKDRASGLGKLGLILSITGCIGVCVMGPTSMVILMSPDIDLGVWADYLIVSCMLTMMLGYVLFGIDALRNRLLPRWNVLPFVIGLLLVLQILMVMLGVQRMEFEFVMMISFLRFALTGIAWALLGYVMLERRERREAVQAV